MSEVVILPATTAATVNTPFDTKGMSSVVISASNLAGLEKVKLFRNVAGTWIQVVNSSGAAVELAAVGTAPGPSYELPGGATYSFSKDSTAGACAVAISFIPNNP